MYQESLEPKTPPSQNPPLLTESQILKIRDLGILGSGRLRRPENLAILAVFIGISKVKAHSKCQNFLACGGLDPVHLWFAEPS